MGQPLVPTVFDFGRKAARPHQAELLDWLAAELIESGWSMKHLHSLIVNSAAYRMSSTLAGGEIAAAKDPENQYWWRRVPIRLESQLIVATRCFRWPELSIPRWAVRPCCQTSKRPRRGAASISSIPTTSATCS